MVGSIIVFFLFIFSLGITIITVIITVTYATSCSRCCFLSRGSSGSYIRGGGEEEEVGRERDELEDTAEDTNDKVEVSPHSLLY